MKKLTTKIEFMFGEHEDIPVFDVNMKLKNRGKLKSTVLTQRRKKLKKVIDASTKLF